MGTPSQILLKTRSALLESGSLTVELEERIEEFEHLCILQIRSELTRNAVIEYLETVAPIEFFRAPASSTGRNHPLWQVSTGGILANTVECCVGIDRKMRMYPSLTDAAFNSLSEDRDIIYAATILSDAHKPADFGKPWQQWAHHRTAATQWRDFATAKSLPAALIAPTYDAIFWHLGRFTPEWPPGADPRTTLSLHTFITHELDMDFSNRALGDIFTRKLYKFTAPNEAHDPTKGTQPRNS